MSTTKLESQQIEALAQGASIEYVENRLAETKEEVEGYSDENLAAHNSSSESHEDIRTSISDEALAREEADTSLATSISEEAAAREADDTALAAALSGEASARAAADTALANDISAEATARGQVDTALGGRIDAEVTARTAADTALGTRIDNIESRGRYLSSWNATTGLPGTEPENIPYAYKTGDYFIVSTVGDTNYKPTGSQYTGDASTVVETGDVSENDTYLYDGTTWELIHTEIPEIAIDDEMSDTSRNPVENRVITTALGGKVDKVTGKQLSTEDYTTAEKNKLAGLENYDDTEVKADIAELESGKVDKVTGKQLSTEDYTTAEKTKLAGLENYDDTEVKADIADLEENKQDKLTAGENITIDENNVISAAGGGDKPYLSLERNSEYLYTVTFDKLSEENDEIEPAVGGCTSFVRDGKLYRNLDWNYDNTASFHVITKDFEGISFINGLNSSNLDDDLIAQLPYHMNDGVNKYGIMVSTHVLFNDWEWTGTGETSITRIPYLILKNAKSIATLSDDIGEFVEDITIPQALQEMGYMLQFLVTDGVTTKIILPPTEGSGVYSIVTANTAKKLTNFRWVDTNNVVRTNLQARPTGVERWNEIGDNTPLSSLRFTKAYENPTRLSEFIGINGTTKDSADAELEEIYEEAHDEYESRERDGKTWQTMHSVVYGVNGMERLYVQEDWGKNYIYASKDYVDESIADIDIPELLPSTGQSEVAGMTQKAITDALASAGGGVKELTVADYNYPVNNPQYVGLWKLEPGVYVKNNNVVAYPTTSSSRQMYTNNFSVYLVGGDRPQGRKFIIGLSPNDNQLSSNGTMFYMDVYEGAYNNGCWWGTNVDNLTSTSTVSSLSANQGKVLKDQIGNLTSLTTTEKTNLVGAINEVAAGGSGGVKVLTSADYNWPTSNPSQIAMWLLEPGTYRISGNLDVRISPAYILGTSLDGATFTFGTGWSSSVESSMPFVLYRYYNASGDNIGKQIFSVGVTSANDGKASMPVELLNTSNVVDSLTKTSSSRPLSAKQGKVLKDLIDARVPAPTSGDTNKFLKGDGTWAEAGSSINVVQTTGVSTADVMSQKAVTDELDNKASQAQLAAVEAEIPTKVSDLTNDSNFATETYVDNAVPDIIDNLTSTSSTNALSAKQGKELSDRISNIGARGRYLSGWNAVTGLPVTNPSTDLPYTYVTGDYYIVSTTGDVAYKPTGTSYNGQPSTTAETQPVSKNDTYLFDGTVWTLIHTEIPEIAVDTALSTTSRNPVENRAITEELNNMKSAPLYRQLTSADNNYPVNNPTSIALWLLPDGYYITNNNCSYGVNHGASSDSKVRILNNGSSTHITLMTNAQGYYYVTSKTTGKDTEYKYLNRNDVKDNLTSTAATSALSANQGKVLKDLVDTKQDQLTAGTNITIDANNVISATGGGASYEYYSETVEVVPIEDEDEETYTHARISQSCVTDDGNTITAEVGVTKDEYGEDEWHNEDVSANAIVKGIDGNNFEFECSSRVSDSEAMFSREDYRESDDNRNYVECGIRSGGEKVGLWSSHESDGESESAEIEIDDQAIDINSDRYVHIGSALISLWADQITANGNPLPTITMTSTDPGEGADLAEGSFIAVYGA